MSFSNWRLSPAHIFQLTPVVPVMVIDSLSDAVPMAEAAGGCIMLKSIAGPFPNIKFCPTGGIHQDNFQNYLALPNVSCVGGSWILPKEAVAAGDWQRVQELAERAVAAAK